MDYELDHKKTILVTGSSGFLGSAMFELLKHDYKVLGVTNTENKNNYFQFDLTNEKNVSELSNLISPNVIIHAAGIKDIQFCEDNPNLAHLVNVEMVKNLCSYFQNSKIIYISTDYVFGGNEDGMYLEKDSPNPATVYGETKYQGELAGQKSLDNNFKVVRTASVYSQNSSFLRFLKMSVEKNSNIESFTDCIFSPTYIFDLVTGIKKIIENDFTEDIFHIAGDPTSRYSFAKAYFEVSNYDLDNLNKTENKGRNIYLFKNLSISSSHTQNILKTKPTSVKDALKELLNMESK